MDMTEGEHDLFKILSTVDRAYTESEARRIIGDIQDLKRENKRLKENGVAPVLKALVSISPKGFDNHVDYISEVLDLAIDIRDGKQ